MGYRLAGNLKSSRFEVRHVEVGAADQARLKAGRSFDCVPPEQALAGANVVVVALNAAAPFAGHLPQRPDLTYFVTHPCHPPIFNDETDMADKKDHFGGVAAKQHSVNALMQGPEEAYLLGEDMDEVVARGVPRETAWDFLLGHMNVLAAVIFGEVEGVFSDACNKAVTFGKPALMRDDWKRVFEPDEIAASIRRIV